MTAEPKRAALRHLTVLVCAVAFVLSASRAAAQTWALPSPLQNTIVKCTTCPGSAKDQWTVGYPSPVKTFTGRFLDSSNTRDYQQTFRTARATWVGVAPAQKRLYMLIGSAIFAYDMDTFFSRLANHEPLKYAGWSFPNNWRADAGGETYLNYDALFYAEYAQTDPLVPWTCPAQDGQDRLFAIDWDDRGNVYLSYSLFGWGIVKDDITAAPGSAMTPVVQHFPSGNEVAPTGPIAVTKSSTGAYTVIVSEAGNTNSSNVFDVTTPNAPRKKSDLKYGIGPFAKTSDRIAILASLRDGTQKLYVYTNDQIAAGSDPLYSLDPPVNGWFTGIDTDGTNFYAACSVPASSTSLIYTLAPNGSSYTATAFDTKTSWGQGPTLRYGAGYVTLNGVQSTPTRGWSSLLFHKSGSTFAAVDLGGYVNHYYVNPPSGLATTAPAALFVTPASVNSAYLNIQDSVVVQRNGHTYYIIMAKGLGDVYELEANDPSQVGDLLASGGTSINLTWSATANTVSYEIWRKGGSSTQWTKIDSVLALPGVSPSYLDVNVTADTAYIYKVRAVNDTASAADSALQLATTMRYTDAILTGSIIRRVHVSEVRSAVDGIRALAGLGGYAWTDADLSNASVKAVHFSELRDALQPALTTLGVSRNIPTGVAAGEIVNADFLAAMRAATR